MKIKVPAPFVPAEGCLADGCLLAVTSHGREREGASSLVSSYKGANPTMGAPPSRPHSNLLPKAPSPNAVAVGLGLEL